MDPAAIVRIELREGFLPEPWLRGRVEFLAQAERQREALLPALQAAYERQGASSFLSSLRGGFALVLSDSSSGRVLIARDRLGIEPLYWWTDGRVLLIAQLMRDIIAAAPIPRPAVDRQAQAQFLIFGCVPHPRSLMEGIHKLPPGHLIELDPKQPSTPVSRAWWSPSFRHPPVAPAQDEAIVRVDELLEASVAHSVNESPGVLLSGGIDSAIILAELVHAHHMAGHREPIQTFTIGFMEPGYTELAAARQIAHHHHADHHELLVTFDDFARALPDLAAAYDEPIGSPSAVPEYLLSRFAGRRVGFALSGEGADELFAGYPKCAADVRSRYLDWLPRIVRRPVLGGMARVVPGGQGWPNPTFGALGFADPADRFAAWFNPADGMAELLTSDLREAMRDSVAAQRLREELAGCDSDDPLDQMLHYELRVPLAEGVLLRAGRTRALAGLRWDAPFLDVPLVEYAAALPAALKVHGRRTKVLLHALSRRRLPGRPAHRRKMNFSVPMEKWLHEPMRRLAQDVLLTDAAIARGYCDPDALRRILAGRRCPRYARGVWALLALELWHRHAL